jgi:hypothetical protein
MSFSSWIMLQYDGMHYHVYTMYVLFLDLTIKGLYHALVVSYTSFKWLISGLFISLYLFYIQNNSTNSGFNVKHTESYELNDIIFLCTSYWNKPFSLFVDVRITLLLSVFQMPVHVNVLSYETRRNRVISSMQFIVDYDYDTEQELWCKIKLAVSMFLCVITVLSQVSKVKSKAIP